MTLTVQHHSFASFDPKGQGRKRPESKNENICTINQMRKELIRIDFFSEVISKTCCKNLTLQYTEATLGTGT